MGQIELFAPLGPVWAPGGQTLSHCFYFPYILRKALNSSVRGCKQKGHNEFERIVSFMSKTAAWLNHVCPTGPHTGWLSRKWEFRIATHYFCFHFHKFLASTTMRRPFFYLGGTCKWAYLWHDLPNNQEAAFSRILITKTSFFTLYVISSLLECFLAFWDGPWKQSHL